MGFKVNDLGGGGGGGSVTPANIKAADGVLAPWRMIDGCIGAWDTDDVVLIASKISQWNDRLDAGNHLVQATDALRWTKADNGAENTASNGYYNVTTPITVNHQSFSVYWVGYQIPNVSTSSVGVLFNTGTIGCYFDALNVDLTGESPPGRKAPPIQFAPAGKASSWALRSGTTLEASVAGQSSLLDSTLGAGTSTIERMFDADAGSIPFQNPTRAVLIFNRKLSAAEVAMIDAYYGTEIQSSKVILTVGSSSNLGVGATNFDASWLGLLTKSTGYLRDSRGQSGALFTGGGGLTALFPATSIVAPTGRDVVVIINPGSSNDLASNVAVATLQTALSDMAANFRTSIPRCKIIGITALPRNASFSGGASAGTYDSARATLTAWMLANEGIIFDTIADVANDPLIGPLSAAQGTTYFADGIHLNDAGHLREALIVYNAVERLGTNTIATTGSINWASRSRMSSQSDGRILFTNNSGTDFDMICFGGVLNTFPALKRTGAGLEARLANDSGTANFTAATFTFQTGVMSSTGNLNWGASRPVIRNNTAGTAVQVLGPGFNINYPIHQSIFVSASAVTPASLSLVECNTLHTNEGAAALQVRNLPTASAGLIYEFYVQDAVGIQVVAAAGDTIRDEAVVSAVAGNIQSTTVGSFITLKAVNATEWIVTCKRGTWAVT